MCVHGSRARKMVKGPVIRARRQNHGVSWQTSRDQHSEDCSCRAVWLFFLFAGSCMSNFCVLITCSKCKAHACCSILEGQCVYGCCRNLSVTLFSLPYAVNKRFKILHVMATCPFTITFIGRYQYTRQLTFTINTTISLCCIDVQLHASTTNCSLSDHKI